MMAKQTKTSKRRTQVKDLPKQEKELSRTEKKKIKGGQANANVGLAKDLQGGNASAAIQDIGGMFNGMSSLVGT